MDKLNFVAPKIVHTLVFLVIDIDIEDVLLRQITCQIGELNLSHKSSTTMLQPEYPRFTRFIED